MLEWICSVSLHICHSYDGLKQAGFLNPVLHVLVRLGVSGDHQKKKKDLWTCQENLQSLQRCPIDSKARYFFVNKGIPWWKVWRINCPWLIVVQSEIHSCEEKADKTDGKTPKKAAVRLIAFWQRLRSRFTKESPRKYDPRGSDRAQEHY